ncbi:MAG: hypothetical protein M1826_003442 [Phylliscum demangeonii]|nr:MAG: hypothetical protein M1826_003442 [Phylliscum demangeonii]
MGNSQTKSVVFTDEVNLNHFKLLRVVGKGAFGKVRIVERKDTGLTFALKYIRKDEVVRSESVRNIIRERRMLEQLNHSFICNLRYSFQDIEYLYIVVDLMNGGDLRFHITRKTFTEDAVRFWMAELGCALRYIHTKGIVHRDVKPDNILLDSQGHTHLADFNVASDFRPEKKLTSKSGTLAYLAPEVYEERGYQSEVDWWSLGVTFYECIYNKRPFTAHGHAKLAKEIMQAAPRYPVTQPAVSLPCLRALQALLDRDGQRRIGAAGWETYTGHPFFQSIDFELLERRGIEPVFVPSSEKTNFDATYDLEELLLEEAPLEARARRQRPREQLRDDATDKQIREEELHRMIETLFEPFDYTIVPTEHVISKVARRHNRLDDQAAAAAAAAAASASASDWARASSCTQSQSSLDEAAVRGTTSSPAGRVVGGKSPSGSPPLQRAITLDIIDPGRLSANSAARRPTLHPHDSSLDAGSSATGPSGRPAARTLGSRDPSMTAAAASAGPPLVRNETSSWPDLADASSPPLDSKVDLKGHKPNGMLGFLSRKKGRGVSPKPQERGVLGKEGARHVVG